MDQISETILNVTEYKIALIVSCILILIPLIQNVLLAPLAFVKEQQHPGMPLRGDHSDRSFRVVRTYQNSVENLPMVLGAIALAILAGVGSHWVNGIALVYLFSRLLFWGLYYSGMGKVAGGPRTIFFVIGLLANVVLACLAIAAFL